MRFIFKTSATMKEYNRNKWWIDEGIIGEKIIAADSTAGATVQGAPCAVKVDCIRVSG